MTKTIAIVQARMGSSRLPAKVMADLGGRPLIDHVLLRLAKARRIDHVWLATSDRPTDTPLADHVQALGFPVYRGDEDDVLSRYIAIARQTEAATLVRVTGDCPFIDPAVVDAVIERYAQGDVDYATNTLARSYPDGLDVEVFSAAALIEADLKAKDPFLRAHVTPYIHGRLRHRLPCGAFRTADVSAPAPFGHLRWTVDETEDLELLRRLLPLLPKNFGWMDVVAVQTRHPELLRINRNRAINEGSARDLVKYGHDAPPAERYRNSNVWFERASRTIPLASQTFSKSHQQWVRGAAPLFIERAKGCRVWDVDGNDYIDHVLGLLPIVLGYGDPDVDAAIENQLEKGIVFPLASPLEAELAERLVRLIPCAEMVRYGKNGSDVTSAAIRLARAHTGRDLVALCGYHGWHDWYIGTTSRNLGVPQAVRDLSLAFPFNDGAALEDLFKAHGDQLAAVILEPAGKDPATPGYLERLRELTERHGAVLVFDEIVTGFRVALGGAQARHGVIPDLATFGKSMGNGMPIAAIVGRATIMRRMEDIFFSGTFGGEALSLAAAIATIDKLERDNVPDRLWRRGERLMSGANAVFERHDLANCLKVEGQGWWPRIVLHRPPVDVNLLNSLLRQELAAHGLLLGASFNLCLAHDSEAVTADTLDALDRAVATVRDHLNSGDPSARLRGVMIQPTFAVRK